MDPESKKLLEDTFKLAKENNEILHKVRGVQKRTAMFGLLRLVLVVGIAFGVFYYIEPYLNKVGAFVSSFTGIDKGVNNVTVGDLLKKYEGIQKP
jgi:small-conductance mechanosensitive channel